jgi:DNA sulfur modification protein DndD
MLLKRIGIENFGPYLGKQEILLKGEEDELVLVHGENMAGKTSLLNAVRWCLYGKAKDRGGGTMATADLVNTDALRSGNKLVAVSLEISKEEQGEEVSIYLKRQRQARTGVGSPSAERDFEEILDVSVDGHVLPPSQFDDQVNALLPEGISRFFLFDGELLKEYEELVSDETTTHSREVQRAIEMILGVPAVQNGKDDLNTLVTKASRAYNQEARKHKSVHEAAEAATRLEDELEHGRAEADRLKAEAAEVEARLTELQAELEAHDHLREAAQAVASAERDLAAIAEARLEKQSRRRELAAELWRDVLEPRLGHEIKKLERERERIGDALRKREGLRQREETLLEVADGEMCPSCGQEIPEEKRLRTRTALESVQQELADLASVADDQRFDALAATIGRLRDVAPAGVASTIAEIEQDLARLDVDELRTKRRKEQLDADLEGFDPEIVQRLQREREGLIRHQTQVEAAIQRAEEAINGKRVDLRDLQQRMKALNEPALEELRLVLDLYESAERAFEDSVDALTDELRKHVAHEASQIFKLLTTDATYTGLQINDHYGLVILDSRGDVVPVRSAGAEQVVALSLIGALNQLAAKRGPVFMDTPFGRLDRKHRENILKFIPTLADQTVLLVHSGEIDPERDIEALGAKVTAQFEIAHKTSSESEIRSI